MLIVRQRPTLYITVQSIAHSGIMRMTFDALVCRLFETATTLRGLTAI